MIIKKFTAATETEAMILAREELGKEAVVMNIKKIKPKGIFKIFKKTSVEVTAAVDDTVSASAKEALAKQQQDAINGNSNHLAQEVKNVMDTPKQTSAIEKKLDNLQNMLEQQIENKETKKTVVNTNNNVSNNSTSTVTDFTKTEQCISLVRKHMLSNEVEDKFIQLVIDEVKSTWNNECSVDSVLTSIYQKIVLKLGQPELIEVGEDNPKFIFFMGPTGVGKTTSIAKIASDLKLNQKLNVALVTSDTYRIAAVEQLRTYANILGIPVNVVYSVDDLKNIKDELEEYDVVLIDTAGRSHKNKEQRDDLKELVNVIDEENRALYLVLSATTKYSDLVHIVNAYDSFTNYRLIFTKLDETSTCGNILNIRLLTGAPLSYTTWGQDVPNDIGRIDGQKIAKQLLGGSI